VIPYDFHPEARAEFVEATVFYESDGRVLAIHSLLKSSV